ncbi:hydroxyacid dehydrogenase [Roseomonas gilardii]|uniref:hydroxyacid dehydrogenase n=1 Tax=Roseomonas gilardii TaxID=257708 RepID=UPI00119CE3AB|nr:hydroxyacid dehydrogenase [Roseomonas gilardii]
MRVALTDTIDSSGEAVLRAAGHDILQPGLGAGDLLSNLSVADAVIVRRKLPDDLPALAPRLLGAVRHGVGVDLIPVEACTAAGVLVANVPGANADAVAEFVVAQMLAVTRQVQALHDDLLSAGWEAGRARTDRAAELRGRTVGIIGLGAIGSRLAEICGAGFRMRVLGYRRDRNNLPSGVEYAGLPDLFAASDFVVLACPLTAETRGLVSAEMIARMRPDAWLLNVARGPVVDEEALVRALRENRIGGAALDVYDHHPLAEDHPLRALSNVILTPHAAGITTGAMRRMSVGASEEVVRILSGGKPVNLVNPEAWKTARSRRPELEHGAAEGVE